MSMKKVKQIESLCKGVTRGKVNHMSRAIVPFFDWIVATVHVAKFTRKASVVHSTEFLESRLLNLKFS